MSKIGSLKGALLVCLLATLSGGLAHAQEFPSRPVSLVVPNAAGRADGHPGAAVLHSPRGVVEAAGARRLQARRRHGGRHRLRRQVAA